MTPDLKHRMEQNMLQMLDSLQKQDELYNQLLRTNQCRIEFVYATLDALDRGDIKSVKEFGAAVAGQKYTMPDHMRYASVIPDAGWRRVMARGKARAQALISAQELADGT